MPAGSAYEGLEPTFSHIDSLTNVYAGVGRSPLSALPLHSGPDLARQPPTTHGWMSGEGVLLTDVHTGVERTELNTTQLNYATQAYKALIMQLDILN